MKAETVALGQATGRILSCSIFKPGGKRLFAKGHVISGEDAELLLAEGLGRVWVTQLEEGEVGEDAAVLEVGHALGCGSLAVKLAPGGRANLFATASCCVLVDEDLLKQINCTASTVIATVANFSYARAGQRIATVKSAPFVVPASQLEAVVGVLRDQGPLLQARPVENATVGVLFSDTINGDRARQLFDSVVRQRLERFGVTANYLISAIEEEQTLARALHHLLRAKPTMILVASTTAPAGPEDAVGRAMIRVGCHLERFLAPVEPGNLLLLGYKDEVPIVSAPGCFRSAKPNVVDLLLPPMLARYRVSGWEIASLGHGGLLA